MKCNNCIYKSKMTMAEMTCAEGFMGTDEPFDWCGKHNEDLEVIKDNYDFEKCKFFKNKHTKEILIHNKKMKKIETIELIKDNVKSFEYEIRYMLDQGYVLVDRKPSYAKLRKIYY